MALDVTDLGRLRRRSATYVKCMRCLVLGFYVLYAFSLHINGAGRVVIDVLEGLVAFGFLAMGVTWILNFRARERLDPQ